eukprot:gene24394-9998_t
MPLEGCLIMDYGAGSGVLAFAALYLGAKDACFTDVDSLAVKSVKQNAVLNNMTAGRPGTTFEVVVANILRGPLIDLAPRLTAYVKPGGTMLLSGILTEQVPEIRVAYGAAFHDLEVESEGLWACITATKNL